jgi:hypothetical protein
MAADRDKNAVRPLNNQKAYVCICVFENTRPVKLVSRAGGDWSILCGEVHPQSADFCRVVGIGHEFEKDPTLLDLIDLPEEWDAERGEVGGAWIRTPCIAEDEAWN